MSNSPNKFVSPHWVIYPLLIAIHFTVGCDSVEPVVTYTIPTEVPDELRAEKARMLAAMVPSGDQVWFFKVTGPKSAIDLIADDFKSFVQSIEIEGDAPNLETLPDGWKLSGSQPSQFRFASINVDTPEKQLDISVSKLGRQPEWDAMVSMNVNRWRGQLGLKPSDAKWADGKPIDIASADAKSVWVDITGDAAAAGGSMMPPPSEMSEKNPPMKADPRLSFDRPHGWRDGRMSSMRMAAFNVGPDDATAEMTVIPAGGDLRGNVDRWLGQVRSEKPADDVVDQAMEAAIDVDVDGRSGKRFFLTGDDAETGTAIDATIVPLDGGMSLFIKMTGPAKTVKGQSEKIASFLKSLKLKM